MAGAGATVAGGVVVDVVVVVVVVVVNVVVEVLVAGSAVYRRHALSLFFSAAVVQLLATRATTDTPTRALPYRAVGSAPMLGLGRRRWRALALLAVVATAGAACGSAPVASRHGVGSDGLAGNTASRASTPSTATSSIPTSSTTTVPAFSSSASDVTAAQLGATWHAGCPVDPVQLRALQLDYWGFDGQAHVGTMVVNASVVTAVTQVFEALYAARFPIQEMVPQSAYGGDDNAAAAADDTSGFNCRNAVAVGPPHWSIHAYGEAIDVNDVQNPYVDGATVIPPAGAAYEDRSDVRPGMAVPGGELVEAFAAVGWQWGGRWAGSPDYQHFSATGG